MFLNYYYVQWHTHTSNNSKINSTPGYNGNFYTYWGRLMQLDGLFDIASAQKRTITENVNRHFATRHNIAMIRTHIQTLADKNGFFSYGGLHREHASCDFPIWILLKSRLNNFALTHTFNMQSFAHISGMRRKRGFDVVNIVTRGLFNQPVELQICENGPRGAFRLSLLYWIGSASDMHAKFAQYKSCWSVRCG